jgi:hypothetical protein
MPLRQPTYHRVRTYWGGFLKTTCSNLIQVRWKHQAFKMKTYMLLYLYLGHMSTNMCRKEVVPKRFKEKKKLFGS